jgi:hypothetical protein
MSASPWWSRVVVTVFLEDFMVAFISCKSFVFAHG